MIPQTNVDHKQGCAPAMINFNLTGDALVHCLKVSGAKVVLVDQDAGVQERIENERTKLGQLGMTLVHLNESLKQDIAMRTPQRPEDSYREGVKGNFPAALFYTR